MNSITITILLSIVTGILTISTAIISYFVIRLIKQLDNTQILSLENKNQIELVKQENDLKHSFNAKELKSLEASIKDLTNEIKDLNTELRSRQ